MAGKNGRKPGGFEPPASTVTLVFEDAAWAGAEVTCRQSVSTGLALEFISFADLGDRDLEDLSPDEVRRLMEALGRFGDDALVEWNMTRKGEPLPATREGMLRLDMADGMKILMAYLSGLQEINNAPLAGPRSKSSTRRASAGGSRRA